MNELFDRFWGSGIRKMDKKKKARPAFDKLMKGKEDPEAFVDMMILDIQKRLHLKQFGFKEMHPTTYLNGERWEDELPESKEDAFTRLTDRSWSADLIEPANHLKIN